MESNGGYIFWALKFGISIWLIELPLKCKKHLMFFSLSYQNFNIGSHLPPQPKRFVRFVTFLNSICNMIKTFSLGGEKFGII